MLDCREEKHGVFIFDKLFSAADIRNEESWANRLRNRRFHKFESLLGPISGPLKIVDIGGTEEFWIQRGWAGREDVHITAINLEAKPTISSNVQVVSGDATNLAEFADDQFDIAFSNSVIEHLFDYPNQLKMAREVERIARAYWVQTPNFWFPIEPHFHIPGWQWMPRTVRIAMLRRYRCGWAGPLEDPVRAARAVDEVRLMTARELKRAFPRAEIWEERVLGLVKSLVAYGGFDSLISA